MYADKCYLICRLTIWLVFKLRLKCTVVSSKNNKSVMKMNLSKYILSKHMPTDGVVKVSLPIVGSYKESEVDHKRLFDIIWYFLPRSRRPQWRPSVCNGYFLNVRCHRSQQNGSSNPGLNMTHEVQFPMWSTQSLTKQFCYSTRVCTRGNY